MDTRFDAAQPRAPMAAPAPTPRPAEAPGARAWAHEWQQAAGATGGPAAAGAGDMRVAWRDASAASTWLAPVRAREDLSPALDEDPQAHDPQTPPRPAAGSGKKAAPHDAAPATPANPATAGFLFLPTAPQMALLPPAAWTGGEPALPADAAAAPPLALAPSSQASAEQATAPTLRPSGGLQPAAPGRAAIASAPRAAPPRSPGETQPFAPTHLQITQGEDGPAVWLRDARMAPDGQAAARVLQALATLGWPHTQRPGALFLNGRPLGPAATARAQPAQHHPDPLPAPKEDSHGH